MAGVQATGGVFLLAYVGTESPPFVAIKLGVENGTTSANA
jgi:hypothetical protein